MDVSKKKRDHHDQNRSLHDFVDSGQVERFSLRNPNWWMVIITALLATFAAYTLREMHRTAVLDQRPWVSIVIPTNFPLEGASIPAPIHIANTGKTPARFVKGDMIATILKKGEGPLFDFSLGHPHNRLYAGVIFPNAPIDTAVTVVRYGAKASETIIPTPQLRQEISDGQSFIIFYGKVSYADIFGRQHWTTFCTGSGNAIQGDDLKRCVNFNDADTEP